MLTDRTGGLKALGFIAAAVLAIVVGNWGDPAGVGLGLGGLALAALLVGGAAC